MEFNEYQKESKKTAQYRDNMPHLAYIALGLAGEAGEVVEKTKKVMRNDDGNISAEKRDDFKKELGDVLWYLSQFATELDISFDDVAKANIKKLSSRMDRGVIRSEGDNR